MIKDQIKQLVEFTDKFQKTYKNFSIHPMNSYEMRLLVQFTQDLNKLVALVSALKSHVKPNKRTNK